jgi:hypothetical protein
MPKSLCNSMFEHVDTESSSELKCVRTTSSTAKGSHGGGGDSTARIEYTCAKGDHGGKNISIASNVYCTAIAEKTQEKDVLWTCAAFENGFDFSDFAQEVAASTLTCASGSAPLFKYTWTAHHETRNSCTDAVVGKTVIPTTETSDVFYETKSQIFSFIILNEVHDGCAAGGTTDTEEEEEDDESSPPPDDESTNSSSSSTSSAGGTSNTAVIGSSGSSAMGEFNKGLIAIAIVSSAIMDFWY